MTKRTFECFLSPKVLRAVVTLAVLSCFSSISNAQPFGGGRGFGGRGGGPNGSLLYLSWRSEVHEELDLSVEQVTMVAALRLDLLAQVRGDREESTLDPEISDKLFSAVLNKNQSKRFDELRLQFEGLRAFDRQAVRTALRVTDEQLDRIRELRRDGSAEAPANEQLEEVLTDEQLANWTAMVGEKATFVERFARRGGRFRGRRDRESLPEGDRRERGGRPQRPE